MSAMRTQGQDDAEALAALQAEGPVLIGLTARDADALYAAVTKDLDISSPEYQNLEALARRVAEKDIRRSRRSVPGVDDGRRGRRA